MRIKGFVAVVFGLCMAASSGAFANEANADAGPPDFAVIRAEQTELRGEVQAGNGIFKDMDAAARAELVSRQDSLLALIEGKQFDDLDEAQKLRAFNLLEEINAVVNKAEDERMVCEFVKKTGSHRKTKQCMTVAQKRKLQEHAQDAIRRESLRGGSLGSD